MERGQRHTACPGGLIHGYHVKSTTGSGCSFSQDLEQMETLSVIVNIIAGNTLDSNSKHKLEVGERLSAWRRSTAHIPMQLYLIPAMIKMGLYSLIMDAMRHPTI